MYRLFFVLISLLGSQAFAFNATNLYQSQVSTKGQTEQERKQLSSEVLEKVVLKVVGDRSIVESRDLSALLAQSESLVQQFQYRRISALSDDLTEPDRLELVMSFNEGNLNSELTKLELPVWTKSRPEVLLWLAVENGQQKMLYGPDQYDSALYKAIFKAADDRGLPVISPIMDLQDQTQLQFSDVNQRSIEKIKSASARYGTKIILIANVKQTAQNHLVVDWQWLINGQSTKASSKGNVATAMAVGIDTLTDQLSQQYSQVIRSPYGREYDLQIANVKDYSDYSGVIAYLSNLQYVSAVKVAGLLDDQLDIKVYLKGELAMFNRTLSLDQVLLEEPMAETSGLMRYRLSP